MILSMHFEAHPGMSFDFADNILLCLSTLYFMYHLVRMCMNSAYFGHPWGSVNRIESLCWRIVRRHVDYVFCPISI